MEQGNEFIVQEILPIDTPNRNGRVYSRSCVEKMITDFNDRKRPEHPLFGELDQPAAPADASKINLDRVSHTVEELYIDGDLLMGKVKILGTPFGKILETLNKEVPDHLSLQLRGIGSLHAETKYVNEYHMVTVDVGAMGSPRKSSVAKIKQIMDSMEKDGLL